MYHYIRLPCSFVLLDIEFDVDFVPTHIAYGVVRDGVIKHVTEATSGFKIVFDKLLDLSLPVYTKGNTNDWKVIRKSGSTLVPLNLPCLALGIQKLYKM